MVQLSLDRFTSGTRQKNEPPSLAEWLRAVSEIPDIPTPTQPEGAARARAKYRHGQVCVCGDRAEVPVKVHWKSGDRTYWYCVGCAEGIVEFTNGTEIDMEAEAADA